MSPLALRLAFLLFGSGMSALVYQVAWFREFRLVFGASTAANAAVLAVFIGGLGAGGLVLGARADRHATPVRLYAKLEALVALTAGVTPLALTIARRIYLGTMAEVPLAPAAATALRLLLTALVLGPPTFLMGGTLPAAARGAEREDDRARRSTGLLYGANTLGAVVGCTASTFVLLERTGTRATLWIACAVNLTVAGLAYLLARGSRAPEAEPSVAERGEPGDPRGEPLGGAREGPSRWIFGLVAAGVVGFAFFLMEMVWYRMLGPILGGTVFTFGLILAAALLGIGLGGAYYALRTKNRPVTFVGFANTCLLEAALLIVPYALGDRIAVLALLLRPLGALGFGGLIASWTVIAALVVIPAAFVSGVQFPMLIALVGEGRQRLARQIGLVYACNTIGAIAGSLAGGFGLLPALTAPGCWRLSSLLLTSLGLVALGLGSARERRRWGLAPVLGLAAASTLLTSARGPTAVFRHSPIGVGRVDAESTASPRALHAWMNDERRAIVWEAEGVESSVALNTSNGWAFVVNGKIDGNARGDAPTQVMGGLLGAILHPGPRSALVVGLGTGSTAGWLGTIASVNRVDVYELEPAIRAVAKACVRVNENVLENPKVHLELGDARERLLSSRHRYDIVFSEPSNPYRAGIASLFTREYYEAVRSRIERGGLFLQWVQAYNVDAQAVRTIYATLSSVFPEVETWELAQNDLLLVASDEPIDHDPARLRARIAAEPFRTALRSAWRAVDLEDVFAHFVATPALARDIARAERGRLNTDDRTLVEFGFARTAGDNAAMSGQDIRRAARARGEHRPRDLTDDAVDWAAVEDAWLAFSASEEDIDAAQTKDLAPDAAARARAESLFLDGEEGRASTTWRTQSREPRGPTEIAVVAHAYASLGDERARYYADRLRPLFPAESDAVLARLLARQRRYLEATSHLAAALGRYRTDPWPWPLIMRRTLDTAREILAADVSQADLIYAAFASPFATYNLEDRRRRLLLEIAPRAPHARCTEALGLVEPHVPWEEAVLKFRADCYEREHHPLLARARADASAFEAEGARPFEDGLDGLPQAEARRTGESSP